MKADSILVIEDDPSLLRVITYALGEAGYQVTGKSDGQAGWEHFTAHETDLLVTDLMLPGMDGMTVLARVRAVRPETPVVMITAFGNVETAVAAMKAGAYDFIAKPFHPEVLLGVVRRGLEYRRLHSENRQLRDWAGARLELGRLLYSSPAMDRVVALARRAAASDATVLLGGESGTGKEVLARAIHNGSARHDRPFVAVACGALPAALVESELFGHTRGAFTGAVADRAGKFQQADGGTLFLDEVGELPLELQPKLLRALQEREVERIGEGVPRKVDVRVIAATHRPLAQLVRDGEFREDLFYRLNVLPLDLPPLRERREDIPALWELFCREAAARDAVAPVRTPPEALARLQGAPWPGNVRELENLARRLTVLHAGRELTPELLPEPLPPEPVGGLVLPDAGLDLNDLEREVIRRALAKHNGNQSLTARYLNITRATLLYRLEKYSLDS